MKQYVKVTFEMVKTAAERYSSLNDCAKFIGVDRNTFATHAKKHINPDTGETYYDFIRNKYKVQGKMCILESDILRAMKHTQSNRAAADFLGIGYLTYREYAKRYFDSDGVSLFEKHKNERGVGIKKSFGKSAKRIKIDEILDNKHPGYSLQKLKEKLVDNGYIDETCDNCGFSEKRITDNQTPLILTFKGDPGNYNLYNLELLCYNCYFLLVGDINLKSRVRTKILKHGEENEENAGFESQE